LRDWRTWLGRICSDLWLSSFQFYVVYGGVVILLVFILEVTPQIAVDTAGIWVDLPGSLARKTRQENGSIVKVDLP
jgi:hypothetical protein